jgi:hypothetical protein
LLDYFVSRSPIADTYPDLDQFVVSECRFEFGEQRVAKPGIADDNQGFQLMAAAAQKFLLVFIEIHGRGVYQCWQAQRQCNE